MYETCNPTSTALPLIIFLVLLALVVCALVSIFIKDRILYKQKKLAARGLSGDGVNKNRERLDTIKK
jgi:flagellar basal body-associated protein FliL